MADAPELTLRRALAELLDTWSLATYASTGPILEQGVRLDGIEPTTVTEYTVLTSPRPLADGRADMIYRAQLYTVRLGAPLVAEQWAADLARHLDQTERLPAVLGISWAWEFSRAYLSPDSQGRSAVAATYYFRGRRG